MRALRLDRPQIPSLAVITSLLVVASCGEPTPPRVLPSAEISAEAGGYEAVDLGTLGGTFSDAVDINEIGQVVGVSTLASGEVRAVLWDNGTMLDLGGIGTPIEINDNSQVLFTRFLWQQGTMIDLRTLGGISSSAADMNELGQVVGTFTIASGERHGFLWDNGTVTDLGTLGGPSSRAVAINDSGEVVGESQLANGETHAFLWKHGTMTDLGTLGGTSPQSRAVSINNNSQVVGFTTTVSSPDRLQVFLWENGTMTDLEVDPTLSRDGIEIADLNAQAQVIVDVGRASGSDIFLADSGTIIDLGSLGGPARLAFDINDLGQVVGVSNLPDPRGSEFHAFLWENGTMIDLGTLGGLTSWARGICESGDVVGFSQLANGETHATLWRKQF